MQSCKIPNFLTETFDNAKVEMLRGLTAMNEHIKTCETIASSFQTTETTWSEQRKEDKRR